MIKKIINKYNQLSITVKASMWFTLCNLILKGISLITVPLFSRLLSSSEYGILAIYTSFEQIILTLATWETALSAYQKGIFKYKKDIHFFTVSTQLISNIITTLFFLAIFFVFPWFNDFTGLSLKNTILLYLYMLLQPAYSCWLIEKRTDYNYKSAVGVTIFFSIISVAVPMTAVIFIGRTAEIKFKYTLIISIIFYIIFYLKNCDYFSLIKNTELVKEQWKFIVTYQVPIVVHALSYTILAQADRIIIGQEVGSSQAAFYSVAYSLGSVVSVFQNSINQALVPWRFEKLEQKKYSDIRNSTGFLLIGIGGLVLAFIFVAPEVMKLLFTKDYYESVWSIPPIALSVYFMFLYTLFVWVENYYERTIYVAIVSVICAIINIILNYVLIGIFGYIVCGYTTVASYILFSLGHFYFMKKICIEVGVKEEIYNIKSIIAISVLLMICSIIITILYPYTVIRYVLFVIIFIICLFNKSRIIEISKRFKK